MLETLSPDVQHDIISFVEHFKDVCSIALVSKDMRLAAAPKRRSMVEDRQLRVQYARAVEDDQRKKMMAAVARWKEAYDVFTTAAAEVTQWDEDARVRLKVLEEEAECLQFKANMAGHLHHHVGLLNLRIATERMGLVTGEKMG